MQKENNNSFRMFQSGSTKRREREKEEFRSPRISFVSFLELFLSKTRMNFFQSKYGAWGRSYSRQGFRSHGPRSERHDVGTLTVDGRSS